MIDIRDAINDLNRNVDFIQRADGEPFMATPGEIVALLDTLQAENAEKDKEIERLTKKATLNAFVKYAMKRACEELVDTEAALSRVEAERDAAAKDMSALATTIRERPAFDTDCCFICKHDTNEECPGCDSEYCFEWRGTQGEG